MANPRGQIVETLGGVERILRLTLGELLALEQRLKCSSLLLMDLERLGVRESVAVVHHAIIGGGGKSTLESVMKMLGDMPGGEIVGLALRVLRAALQPDEPSENPQEPAASP